MSNTSSHAVRPYIWPSFFFQCWLPRYDTHVTLYSRSTYSISPCRRFGRYWPSLSLGLGPKRRRCLRKTAEGAADLEWGQARKKIENIEKLSISINPVAVTSDYSRVVIIRCLCAIQEGSLVEGLYKSMEAKHHLLTRCVVERYPWWNSTDPWEWTSCQSVGSKRARTILCWTRHPAKPTISEEWSA